MALSSTSVLKLYNAVIDDVITNVRDGFLDEGVDEQVLQEIKQVWTTKLMASKAVELALDPPEPQPPPIVAGATKSASSKANGAKAKANKTNSQPQVVQDTVNGGAAATNNTSPQNGSTAVAQKAATTVAAATSNPSASQSQQPPPSGPPPAVAGLDPNKIVPIQITLPPTPGGEPRVLSIEVPASTLQENQLQQVITGSIITSIMNLPSNIASQVLQQHINVTLQAQSIGTNSISLQRQVDGTADTSDEDASDASDDNIDGDDEDLDKDDDDEDQDPDIGAEEEPLNSEDDVTDEDATDLFDTDNVVVCQYDKITRSRNKWKFYLKDGIMNIGGKDYVFQKSNGDAEW